MKNRSRPAVTNKQERAPEALLHAAAELRESFVLYKATTS